LVSKVFLLLIKMYKIIFKLVSKLVNKVLSTTILDSKLISKRVIETDLKYKYLVDKILVTNG